MSSYYDTAYRIGAVSRLTGIPTDTIRMWERRYGVVEPGRAGGGSRLYSRDDIRRLAMVKRLVDAGQAIGTVAHLNEGQLEESLSAFLKNDRIAPGSVAKSCRVTIVGDALSVRFGASKKDTKGLEIVGAYGDRETFERNVGRQKPDILLLECPTVHEDSVREVWRLHRRSGAKHVIVVYAFGPARALTKLEAGRAVTIRAPVAPGELRRICLTVMERSVDDAKTLTIDAGLSEPIPPRRFSDDVLARVSSASTAVQCECPHHLSDLIMSLTAFEDYSAECESRSAADAALHGYLHATTARARGLLEAALRQVLEAEGFDF